MGKRKDKEDESSEDRRDLGLYWTDRFILFSWAFSQAYNLEERKNIL